MDRLVRTLLAGADLKEEAVFKTEGARSAVLADPGVLAETEAKGLKDRKDPAELKDRTDLRGVRGFKDPRANFLAVKSRFPAAIEINFCRIFRIPQSL